MNVPLNDDNLDELEQRLKKLKPIQASDELEQNVTQGIKPTKVTNDWKRALRIPVGALAACFLLWAGWLTFFTSSIDLHPAWAVEAESGAEYEVEDSLTIRLFSGELRLKNLTPNSQEINKITIETPQGKIQSKQAEFLVGAYKKEKSMKAFTRTFVLAGLLTLFNSLGSVEAKDGQLIVVKDQQAPVKQVSKSNSDFGFTLLRELSLNSKDENLFFSPYSLSVALSMLSQGARSDTLEEIAEVLQLPETFRRIGEGDQRMAWELSRLHSGHSAIQKMLQSHTSAEKVKEIKKTVSELESKYDQLNRERGKLLERSAPGDREKRRAIIAQMNEIRRKLHPLRPLIDQYELQVGNGLWGEQTVPFSSDFLNQLKRYYGAGIEKVDFIQQSEQVRGRINNWVSEQTKGLIRDLFRPGSIRPDSRMVLANAVYFKGSWVKPFPKRLTQDREFTGIEGEKFKVPMMAHPKLGYARYAAFNGDGSFFETPKFKKKDQKNYYPNQDGFSLLEMYFKGGTLSLLTLTPQSHDGLKRLETQLTQERMNSWVSHLDRRDVNVHYPKLHLEDLLNLKQTLSKLGLKKAFDPRPGMADFSGMLNESSSHQPLFVDSLVQKSYVTLDEVGVEAAAATGVAVGQKAVVGDVPFVPTFKADRPFVFLIRHRESGTVLFVGRVLDPRKS